MADRAKGKSMYPLLRAVFNIIFLSSITSLILSWSHPDIKIPNPFDFKELINFCIEGYFFVPFAIFMIVYLVTMGISGVVFMWLGDFKNRKVIKKIIAFQIEKNDLVEGIKGIEEAASLIQVIDITKEKSLQLYKLLKPTFKKRDISKSLDKIDESKKSLSDNFAMTLRGFIAVTIYFINIPSFGGWLYSLSCIVICICFIVFVLAYKLLDILPHIMHKAIEAERIYNIKDEIQ
ncbi:MAG TPA: hypothetical protein PLQ93_01335 [Bacteroidia bacterium]|nr:hypothetical protein [Bacteroidia bacterium]